MDAIGCRLCSQRGRDQKPIERAMKKKKQPAGPIRLELRPAQSIALRNTMALRAVAIRQAAAPYDKQMQDIAHDAIKQVGHDPDARDWKAEDGSYAVLIGEPRASAVVGPKQKA